MSDQGDNERAPLTAATVAMLKADLAKVRGLELPDRLVISPAGHRALLERLAPRLEEVGAAIRGLTLTITPAVGQIAYLVRASAELERQAYRPELPPFDPFTFRIGFPAVASPRLFLNYAAYGDEGPRRRWRRLPRKTKKAIRSWRRMRGRRELRRVHRYVAKQIRFHGVRGPS